MVVGARHEMSSQRLSFICDSEFYGRIQYKIYTPRSRIYITYISWSFVAESELMSDAADLVSFGEALLTYKPAAATEGEPLAAGASSVVQAIGGSELNVAVALAQR